MQTINAEEIVIAMPDEVGLLSRITTAITAAQINMKAICGYSTDNTAHFRLVTDDNEKAAAALKAAGFECNSHPVMMCEVSPSEIHPEIREFGDGLEVTNNYWCAAAHSGEHALIIFSPKDNLTGVSM
jgi:hypothetical protein